MKTITRLSVLGLFMASSMFVKAQLHLGFEAGYSIGGGVISNMNLGMRGEYSNSDRNSFFGGVSYLLPQKWDWEIDLPPVDMVNGKTKTVPTSISLSGILLHFQYKRFFFGGEFQDGFGFYGALGVGLNYFTLKETITGSYDKTDHKAPEGYDNDVAKENAIGFSLNFGIGADFPLNKKQAIYSEIFLHLPANEANGQAINVQIPGTINLRVGYRFELMR